MFAWLAMPSRLRYVPMREDLDLEVDYDNLTNVQRVAVEAVGQDDVLVIDARGETGSASLGNILATRIKMCGGAGIVTDGALRDANAFREIDISTYTRGVHATTSSTKHHPVGYELAGWLRGRPHYAGRCDGRRCRRGRRDSTSSSLRT